MVRKAVRPGDLLSPDCPSRGVLDHLTSRWGVLVLRVLLEGTRRFSDLRRTVGGVSEKMLTQTLQALEADGFVLRKAYAEIPPRVEYSLTPMGADVAKEIRSLTEWIEQNLPRILEARRAQEAKRGRLANR